MSTSTALVLIAATTFSAMFVFLQATKMANDTANEIATGVVRGIRISNEYRSILLYGNWFGQGFAAVLPALFLGILNVRIAGVVTDENVQSLAYVVAVIGFGGVAYWVIASIPEFQYYRSLVRQTEAAKDLP